MRTVFAAVKRQQIRDFENGEIGSDQILDILTKADRVDFHQVDRAVHVLANDDEFSEYYDIMGGGEILAGENGEALIIDPVYFENENGGGSVICDPAVYMTNDEIKRAADILKEIDESKFKEIFDLRMKKLTRWSFLSKGKRELKKSAADISNYLWNEVSVLKRFYETHAENGNFIVIFIIYENEDFE